MVQDVIVKPAAPLVPGGSTASQIVFAPGGFGPNVAWTAALEGAAVRFVGQTGADTIGSLLADELQEVGVEVAVTRKGATATVVVLVGADGQRTMAYDTSSFALSAQDVTAEQLAGVSVLHLYEGLFDSPTAEGTWRAVQMVRSGPGPTAPGNGPGQPAHASGNGPGGAASPGGADSQGGLVSLDAGNVARIMQVGRSSFLDLVDRLAPEVFFANEEEAEALWPQGRVKAPGLVIVKHGASPTVAYSPDGEELLKVEVAPVAEVVDTTGAGDAMAGGFLAAWAAGCGLRQAIEAGHRTARTVVTQYGARLPRSWQPPARRPNPQVAQ